MKKLTIYLLAFVFAFAAQAATEIKGTPAELTQYLNGIPKDVPLTVSSKKNIKADTALVHFVVYSTKDTLKEAMENNGLTLNKISASLVKMGFDQKAISARAYSSLPGYSFYSSKPTSYNAKKVITVKVKTEADLLKILGTLDNFKDSCRYMNLSFKYNNDEETAAELLTENLQKVANKKALFEKAFGVKLRVKAFREGTGSSTSPHFEELINTQKMSYTSIPGKLTKSSHNLQWQQSDHQQKGFSETEVSKSLTVIYSVVD
jgi:uncharacterized protein YggE